MRLLKNFGMLALLLALCFPGALTEIKHAAGAAVSSFASSAAAETPAPGRDYADRDAHSLACTLFRKWSKADAATREASSRTVASIAEQALGETSDPAARALLTVVPAAVGHGSSAQSRSAQMLLQRECRPTR